MTTMETIRTTFNHRVNLDVDGQTAMLFAQYVALDGAIKGMREDEGIVITWNGGQERLTREEAEERQEEIMGLYVEHLLGDRERQFYRLLAAMWLRANDIAEGAGDIPPHELIDA